MATQPAEVKRILRLAKATKDDIFYDLGCGHGRVCIIASKQVKRAVGIEDHIATYKEAVRAVRKAGLQDKVKIRNSDVSSAKIGDATMVYTMINESYKDLERFERLLPRGSRFISAYVPLIGVIPDKKDGSFYLMKMPFKHAKDEDDWARSVLGTKNGTAGKLYKKYTRWYGREFVKDLKKTLRRRLRKWNSDARF
jgi:SAM-dependent methyltransferase